VWILAEAVRLFSRSPHDVEVIETNINQSDELIVDLVLGQKPDVLCISTYIWNAGKLPGIFSVLRERLPDTVIVLGGPEASNNPDYWLGMGADHIFKGEIDFVDPYTDKYLAALKGKIAYIEASRGCPFKCAFCLSGGSALQFFPLDVVKEQILKLSRSDARTVKFVDRTFNCNKQRAYDIFEYIINLDTDRCFHFEVAADLFDDRTLTLLESAPPGRLQLEAGLQSFYEPSLKAVSRKTDLLLAEENIRRLMIFQNIHVHVDLIAGLPYEDYNSFQNSFNRAYALGTHTLQLGFLKFLHGSTLREKNDYSIIYDKEPPYEIISSPWLNTDELKILKQTENALQNTYNKGRFLSVIEYVQHIADLEQEPFLLYKNLGEAVPHNGKPLGIYAEQIFNHFVKIPNVNPNILLEHMLCDWLSMVKGNDMPKFMKIGTKQQKKQAISIAQCHLNRIIRRDEATVLPSGKTAYVDSENRNPVTGLYKIYIHA